MLRVVKFTLIWALLFSFSFACFAEELKVGFVDVFEVFNDYEKTKDYDEKLEVKKEKAEKQLDKKKEEIEKLQGKLSLLKEKEKAKEEEQISQKIEEYRELERKSFTDIKKDRDESMKAIVEDIDKIVAAYAKENGYDLILNENVVLYGNKSMDITSDILKISNKKYKKKK